MIKEKKYAVIVRLEYFVEVDAISPETAHEQVDCMSVIDMDFENEREIVLVTEKKDA